MTYAAVLAAAATLATQVSPVAGLIALGLGFLAPNTRPARRLRRWLP